MTTDATGRDASGRFACGNRGRPRGSKNRRKAFTPGEFSAAVAQEASARLEGLMGRAVDVIEQQLDAGDARTAIWVLDRLLPRRQHRLSEAVPDADLSSMEGIVETAQRATEMATAGRIGLEEAQRVLSILSGTAALIGYRQIGELRVMLEDLQKGPAMPRSAEGSGVALQWGRAANQPGT